MTSKVLGKGAMFQLKQRLDDDSDQGSNLSQDEMDLVVAKLTQIAREATLDYAIRVGSLIIHYFYGGDTSAWRDRRAKPLSFRRLSERPDLPMSATALYRCVATFVMCERLDVVRRWKNLTATHLRTVINLTPAEQTRLLSAANTQRWSVRELAEAAASSRAGTARSGRPPTTPLLKLARTLARTLHENGRILTQLSDVETLSSSEHEQVQHLFEQARWSLERACEELRRARLTDVLYQERDCLLPAAVGIE